MKRSGIPADGFRPLEMGEWRGRHPMRKFGRGTSDAGDEEVRWQMVVGENRWRQARRVPGEAERVVRMEHTQDIIHKDPPEGSDAEDTWGGGSWSGRGRYASGVKVVFADAGKGPWPIYAPAPTLEASVKRQNGWCD